MYKLKEMAKRSSAFVGAIGLLVGISSTALPMYASADTLNPLTERSLTLSSSAPGWSYTDGSGNSLYAPPNGGSNGRQTGNIFTFRVSSAKTIKAFTFQYCTQSAGKCQAPGNDDGSGLTSDRGSDDVAAHKSDLNITSTSPSEVSGSDYATISNNTTADASGAGADTNGDADQYGDYKQVPDGQDTYPTHSNNPANGIAGNFVVLTGNSATGYVDTYSGGWNMSVSNQEESTTTTTGKNNMITLAVDGTTNTGVALNPGDYVKVVFWGTDSNYITNPGEGAFFVKINDYDSTTNDNPINDPTHIVDGGVTVANVMNQSIAIQTKVLETMQFSVGTVDPDTLVTNSSGDCSSELCKATANETHGQCDPIATRMTSSDPENVLYMGNETAEHSLQTSDTYATHSYWRLSSNSSGGATVYYAGNTLYNTEGDRVAPIGTTAAAPHLGTEQFGLAIDNDTAAPVGSVGYAVNHDNANDADYDYGADNASADNGDLDNTATTGWNAVKATLNAHDPQLYPLVATTNYKGGGGLFNPHTDGTLNAATKFAFDESSNTIPVPIATESSQVVNCVTAKMRYIANIAATTPAGIYTTKINYIAAPQY